MAEEAGKLEESTFLNVDKRYTDPETGKFAIGNPGGGRKKDSFSLVAILKRKLQECPPGENKKTYAELLVDRVLRESVINGNTSMLKDVVDRIDGKAVQTMVVENEDDEEVEELRGLLKELTTSYKKTDEPIKSNTNGDTKLAIADNTAGGEATLPAPAADVPDRGEAGRPDANGGTTGDILGADIQAPQTPADRELHPVREESDGGAGMCDNLVHSGGVSVSGGSN